MPGPFIVICSQLNLHREVIQGVLQAARPELPVHAVAPEDLDSSPEFRNPRLIVCTSRDVIRKLQPLAWILLFPDDENLAEVGIGEERRFLPGASIPELIAVVDEVWSRPQPVTA